MQGPYRTPLEQVMAMSGRTRRWLAGRLNIDETLVSRYATGDRDIPEDTLLEIAEVLGVPVEWLRSNQLEEATA